MNEGVHGLNYIAGAWVEAAEGGTLQRRNPADQRDVVGIFPASTAADATRAVAAVRTASLAWAKADPEARAAVLERTADLILQRLASLARELTREEGKILRAATQEWRRAAANFRLYAGEALRTRGETFPVAGAGIVYSLREPVGVVLAITPWNFPVSIPSRKIAPALATGNGVLFKPSEVTPLAGQRIVELLLEAGLPSGVISLVQGRGADLGESLIRADAVGAVTFTGSYPTGCRIHQLAGPDKRLQLEMGGKNPCIVLADADPVQAAEIAAQGAFSMTGQACTATSRVLVASEIYDRVVREIIEKAQALKVGNGLDPSVTMGPLASEAQYRKVLEMISVGKAEELRIACGGDALSGLLADGYFVAPTVFVDVPTTSRLSREEIFGPVMCISRVADYDEALDIANSVEYGLAASIVTRDLSHALSFARDIEAGVIKVNSATGGVAISAPFGGIKHSSNQTYKEQAGHGVMDFYTRTKTVYLAR
jgi:acyl-CoA reductase-like NAD-dependent aldehyde dehydrogenase